MATLAAPMPRPLLGLGLLVASALALMALTDVATTALWTAPTQQAAAAVASAAPRPTATAAPARIVAANIAQRASVDPSVGAEPLAQEPASAPRLGLAASLLALAAGCVAAYRALAPAARNPLQPLAMQEVQPNAWAMAAEAGAKPLAGKVALVTGATRGIGAAVAKALGEAGAVVVGTATSESGAQGITEALAGHGLTGEGLVLNVTDEEGIKAALKTIGDKYGAPSIVVNNAGITKDKLLLMMKDDDWDAVIATNLTSVFRVSRAAQRAMTKARWGRIISISSVVGTTGNPGQCNYAAAKAGIEGFTKSLARELASRNITVNSVAPGFIATDMTKDLPAEWADKLKAQIPLGRMGSAEEVADAVVFLASPSASYITGQTLHVNGGMYMN
eukprot:EG_transcript_11779